MPARLAWSSLEASLSLLFDHERRISDHKGLLLECLTVSWCGPEIWVEGAADLSLREQGACDLYKAPGNGTVMS